METSINYDQIKRIHGLLPAHAKKDPEAKEEIIVEFTEDVNKTSVKDLTFSQANFLIMQLGGTPVQINRRYLQFDKSSPKHMNILSLCHQYGWTVKKGERFIADMSKLGAWLQTKKAPVKKPIIDMKPEELNKTITALTNMAGGNWK